MSRRAAALLVAAALGWLVPVGTALAQQPDPLFDPAQARQLAGVLAEATRQQGVCYGWRVVVDDNFTGQFDGVSVGSSFGAGVPLPGGGQRCTQRVRFRATITYTGASSTRNDYATYTVRSPPGGPTTGDLAQLELVSEADLVGRTPGAAVARAVAALPRLAAESGLAPPVQARPATSTPPNPGRLSDDPGSDYLRRAGGWLIIGVVLLVAGTAFAVHAVATRRRGPPPTAAGPPTVPPGV